MIPGIQIAGEIEWCAMRLVVEVPSVEAQMRSSRSPAFALRNPGSPGSSSRR